MDASDETATFLAKIWVFAKAQREHLTDAQITTGLLVALAKNIVESYSPETDATSVDALREAIAELRRVENLHG